MFKLPSYNKGSDFMINNNNKNTSNMKKTKE